MTLLPIGLPITLPFTLFTPSPPPDRTCHVLNTVTTVTVLPNTRVFTVPAND